jgi:hypothetical protein
MRQVRVRASVSVCVYACECVWVFVQAHAVSCLFHVPCDVRVCACVPERCCASVLVGCGARGRSCECARRSSALLPRAARVVRARAPVCLSRARCATALAWFSLSMHLGVCSSSSGAAGGAPALGTVEEDDGGGRCIGCNVPYTAGARSRAAWLLPPTVLSARGWLGTRFCKQCGQKL